MVTFFRLILRLAFIAGIVFLFFTACSSHKRCGEAGAKKKYSAKRYRGALHERDSLCNLAKQHEMQLASMTNSINTLQASYNDLVTSSGSEVNKLSTDLSKQQQVLRQREERLRQLETALRQQDSVLNLLNASVKNALMGFSADELTVEMRGGKVYISLSDKLLFKSGSASVEEKGREALKKVAEVLNKNQDVSIAIEGHTDNVPVKTAVYHDNWDLSAARATNVVRLLTNEYGMDPKRLTASGKGEFFPVADNSTTEGKAKNRRTELVLSPKLDELMKLISKK
jgi:chemotaxis protein MotB